MVASNSGTYVWDRTLRKLVKVSDRIPSLARHEIAGSRPYCAPNGETLDFGDGPIHVANASEKRAVMRRYGVAEAQGRIDPPRYDPSTAPSFKEFFHKEHGVPLSEATGLIKKVGSE